MAITIDATVGGASANSYITLSDANTIVEGLILDDDVTAWDNSSTDNKNRALYTAAIRVDRERFLGARVTDTQALQWPRTGVRKPDTYINTYATGFPFRITTDYFTDTEIPEQVKKAQVILAVYLNNNRDGLGLSGLEDYKTVKLGNIEATPNFYGAVVADRVPPLFDRYFTTADVRDPRDAYSDLPIKYASELGKLEKEEMLRGLKKQGEFMTRGFKDMLEAQDIDWDEAYNVGKRRLRASGGRAGYMGGGITGIRKPHAIPPERQGLRSIMINGKKS